MRYKIGLIKCVTNRAYKICSNSKLAEELANIKSVLLANDYPISLIDKHISNTQTIIKTEGPKFHSVSCRLPFLGDKDNGKIKYEINRIFKLL